MSSTINTAIAFGAFLLIFFFFVGLVTDYQRSRKANERLRKIEDEKQPVDLENLTRFYRAQLATYQAETLRRARVSFFAAIFAMVAGLAFVGWGGFHIINNPGLEHVAAGTSISAIGGAIGAYIAKTFLDIHRLSLSQLNFYFRQPVVNSHVLTAQRVAEQILDGPARQSAYEKILANVINLIREDNQPSDVWMPKPTDQPSPLKAVAKAKPAAKAEPAAKATTRPSEHGR